jgi:nucleoside 2-deoxyribosyltransferase
MGEIYMKVYIAGPIAGRVNNQGYRKRIKKILNKLEIEYICPFEHDIKDYGKKETERLSSLNNGMEITQEDRDRVKKIIDRDLAHIDECNVLIAYWPESSPGTDNEIFYQSRIKNRVTIIFSKNPYSWVVGLGDYFVHTYKDLEDVLKECLDIEKV